MEEEEREAREEGGRLVMVNVCEKCRIVLADNERMSQHCAVTGHKTVLYLMAS